VYKQLKERSGYDPFVYHVIIKYIMKIKMNSIKDPEHPEKNKTNESDILSGW